ncbi:MAG: NAD-dependent protein deacylase [Eubacteriaceae bacterium]|jgi:NAD-dependent deacetylase|nr:NAD-dependent protein deacylase [Eubacteriaceae bacterium]
MTTDISVLQKLIDESDNIVFFGGAGVSVESGLADFRSEGGIYNQKYDYPAEEMLSHHFFYTHTDYFYTFHKDKMINLQAQPNEAHKKLAMLEKAGKLKAVITQNIDGLHQMAGSENVLELHGTVNRNLCMRCKKCYDAAYVKNSDGIPLCSCGGTLKPDVVLYGESLDETVISRALYYIKHADMLIVGGTSLTVYPAAGMIDNYRGEKLVLINKTPTLRDHLANYAFYGKIGEIFSQITVR